jgi:hypothetical protein
MTRLGQNFKYNESIVFIKTIFIAQLNMTEKRTGFMRIFRPKKQFRKTDDLRNYFDVETILPMMIPAGL